MMQGYTLLALQAHFPSLHPETCETNRELNNCKPVKGWNLTLLYMSLLLFAVGEGCMRSCIPSLGGDQFSNDDPKKSQLKSMFLICLKFANSLGAIIGLVFLVWIDNNLGWNIGFMICALIVLVGLLGAASGMPFYRMQKPIRSPLTTTLEVKVPTVLLIWNIHLFLRFSILVKLQSRFQYVITLPSMLNAERSLHFIHMFKYTADNYSKEIKELRPFWCMNIKQN